jgi:hypothetical protein
VVVAFLTLEGPLPFLAGCLLVYIAIALLLRLLSRIWWSPRAPAPPEAAEPKPPVIEGVPEVGATDTPPAPQLQVPTVVPVRPTARRSIKTPLGPVQKTFRRKMSELTSSMLVATILASLFAIAIATLLGFQHPEDVVLLGLVGTAGSWAILIPSKGWEGSKGDAVVRRLVMMGLGAAVGLLAGVASEFLLVSLPHASNLPVRFRPPINWHTPVPHLYNPAGEPFKSAYAVYYASLFLVPRWWRQADPYRKKRFRFGPLFGVGIWAWLASQFWEFSDPWAVACAVLIAAVVQFSSSWHPEELTPIEAKEMAV